MNQAEEFERLYAGSQIRVRRLIANLLYRRGFPRSERFGLFDLEDIESAVWMTAWRQRERMFMQGQVPVAWLLVLVKSEVRSRFKRWRGYWHKDARSPKGGYWERGLCDKRAVPFVDVCPDGWSLSECAILRRVA